MSYAPDKVNEECLSEKDGSDLLTYFTSETVSNWGKDMSWSSLGYTSKSNTEHRLNQYFVETNLLDKYYPSIFCVHIILNSLLARMLHPLPAFVKALKAQTQTFRPWKWNLQGLEISLTNPVSLTAWVKNKHKTNRTSYEKSNMKKKFQFQETYVFSVMCLLQGNLSAGKLGWHVSFISSFDLLSPNERGKAPPPSSCARALGLKTQRELRQNLRGSSHTVLFCIRTSCRQAWVCEHIQIATFVESVSQKMA